MSTAVHVHEIVPKSKTKDWDKWENRVPLCAHHHELVHKHGAKKYADLLTKFREKIVASWGIENAAD